MAVQYANNATTSLASNITSTQATMTVSTGTGALFPQLTTAGDVFYATLDAHTGHTEIVQVTAVASDTFTIVRGQDGTTASAWTSGTKVDLRLTRIGMQNLSASEIYIPSGFRVYQNGTKLDFEYNGTLIMSLDSSGNVIALADVTAYGTP